MATWLIILLFVIGAFWLIGLFLFWGTFFYSWKKDGEIEWMYLVIGVFFPICFLGVFFYFLIEILGDNDEIGIISFFRRIIKSRREDRKDKRIEKAYLKGEIKREDLPRLWCDGITKFELKGELLEPNRQEFVYIENESNAVLNSFFERHNNIALKHDYRIIYLPSEIKRLKENEIVEYWSPGIDKQSVKPLSISSIDLLKELYYPEDAQNIHHGLMMCSGRSSKYGAEYFNGNYYQLEEGSDEAILQQIESIVDTVYKERLVGLSCAKRKPSSDSKPTEDYADEQFEREINNLVDEIKERVNKLEQHGISLKLLVRMISEEPKLSRLVVTKDLRILLPDYNKEIEMEPINKAVFLLFLRHPEGIVFKHLPDYRKELAEIYQLIRPLGLNERAIQSIEDVTNPLLNSINEKCARIRSAFVKEFDEHLAKNYFITGERGEAKKIALPRDLVIWEE